MTEIAKLKILARFAYSVIFRSSIIASALAVFLISSYMFGPSGRGVISFVGSFYFASSLLLSFGLARVAYQNVTKRESDSPHILPAAVGFVYLLSLAIFLIVIGVCTVMESADFLPGAVRPIHFVLLFGWFTYNLWLNFSNFLFSAVGRTNEHEVFIFITRVGQVLILSTLLFYRVSLEVFLLFYSITCILIVLIESAVLLGRDGIARIPKSIQRIRDLFSGAFWSYADNIAQSAYPLAIFVIGIFVSNASLGNYHFSLQVLSALIFPFVVLQIKIQEWLVPVSAKRRPKLIFKYLKYTFLGGTLISLVGFVIPFLLPFIGLADFSESTPILKTLLITIPLYGLYTVFQGIWVVLHRAQISSIVGFIFAGITLIAAIVGGPIIGIWSGPIGTFAALIVVLIINYYFLIQWLREVNPAVDG